MKTVIFLSFLGVGLAGAQEKLERFAPKPPPSLEVQHAVTPKIPASVPRLRDDARADLRLRGLVFVASLSQVRAKGASLVHGISINGVPLIDNADFRARLAPFIGKPITMELVQAISTETARYYGKQDRAVVSVVSPEQDVTNGVVQFVVTEGHVGEFHVAGNRYFKSSLFRTGLGPGDPIRMSQLEADAAFYERNPFRSVTAELNAGKAPGTTDITFRVNDKLPLRVYAGYENSGVESTGEHRLFAGFNYGNLFGLGQEFSYQFTTDVEFSRLFAHSGTWTIPLPWKHVLAFSGTYAKSIPEVGPGFDLEGTSWQAGGRYIIPLRAPKHLTHELALGYDFKYTNNDLQFGGEQVFETPIEISQLSLGYNAMLTDRWGRTGFALAAFYSPGGMSGHNNDEDFQAARAGSESEYFYGTLGVDRFTRLPFGLTWAVSFKGQLASENLQATEQFVLGGASTVRGYDELVASGDSGLLVRNEILTPPVSLARLFRATRIQDGLQFLVFHDYGLASTRHTLPGEAKNTRLQSVGLGLRWQIKQYLSVYCDYGWQLNDIGLDDDARAHIGATLSF